MWPMVKWTEITREPIEGDILTESHKLSQGSGPVFTKGLSQGLCLMLRLLS